jgi:hypothetical protein
MNAALETAVALLGAEGLAATAVLAYVVRRVSPWPKPPGQPGPAASRRSSGTGPGAGGQAPDATGAGPARSTTAGAS